MRIVDATIARTARSGRPARRSPRSPSARASGGPRYTATSPTSARCSWAARGRGRAQPGAGPGDVGDDLGPARATRRRAGRVYGWYERVEPMLTAVTRDAAAMPIVAELEGGVLGTSPSSRTASSPAGAPAERRQTATRDDRPRARLPGLANVAPAWSGPRGRDRGDGVGGSRPWGAARAFRVAPDVDRAVGRRGQLLGGEHERPPVRRAASRRRRRRSPRPSTRRERAASAGACRRPAAAARAASPAPACRAPTA